MKKISRKRYTQTVQQKEKKTQMRHLNIVKKKAVQHSKAVLMVLMTLCFLWLGNGISLSSPAVVTKPLWQHAEWNYQGPTVANPYDVIATATFTKGSATRTSYLYYAGLKGGIPTWRVRFTGIDKDDIGMWSFTTNCASHASLHGHTGFFDIHAPAEEAYGFQTSVGTKWARQVWRDGDLQVEAFIPQYVMYRSVGEYHNNPAKIDNDIQVYLGTGIPEGHGFTGFNTVVGGRWFDYTKADTADTVAAASNNLLPSLGTFEALELLITRVHQAGGTVHIWAWGRTNHEPAGDIYSNPSQLYGGYNGEADRRLQRYIAARLGALPGWSLGYGWDVDAAAGGNATYPAWSVLQDWYGNMKTYLGGKDGYFHFLGARNVENDYAAGGFANNKNTDIRTPFDFQDSDWPTYWSTDRKRPSGGQNYDNDHQAHKNVFYGMYRYYYDRLNWFQKPVFFSDRYRIRHTINYGFKDFDSHGIMTRRGLWHSAMAGGVANIWGNEANDFPCSYPYFPGNGSTILVDLRAQLRTYHYFWKGRFFNDLVRDTNFNDVRTGVCLKKPCTNSCDGYYIFYIEDAASLNTNLTTYSQAIVVDTKNAYAETVKPISTNGVITFDSSSDWAVIIGDPNCAGTSRITVTSPNATSEWRLSNPYTISWDPCGTMQGVIKIVLKRPGFRRVLASNLLNNGSYNWTVPADLTEAADYFIVVRTMDGTVVANSPLFKISNCQEVVRTLYAIQANNAWRWDWQVRSLGAPDNWRAVQPYYNDYKKTDPLIALNFDSWTLPPGAQITNVKIGAKIAWEQPWHSSYIWLSELTHNRTSGWVTYTGNVLDWVELDITSAEATWTKAEIDALQVTIKRRWVDTPRSDFYVDSFKIVITTLE